MDKIGAKSPSDRRRYLDAILTSLQQRGDKMVNPGIIEEVFTNIMPASAKQAMGIEVTEEELKDEQSKLQPLVSADKEVVEALFSAQEARAKESAKVERWIGFVLGVAASIVASIFLMIIQYFLRARRSGS